MIEDDGHYTASQVAHLVFDHDVRWFQRNRAKLERVEGFPKPISCIGRPRWLGQRLREWLMRPNLAPDSRSQGGNVIDYDAILRGRLKQSA